MRIVLHPILVLLLVALLQTTARGIPSVKRGRSFQHNRVAPIATIDAKAYPSSSDAYPLDYDKENRETEKVTNDLVVFYTRNSKRRIVVAVAAGMKSSSC